AGQRRRQPEGDLRAGRPPEPHFGLDQRTTNASHLGWGHAAVDRQRGIWEPELLARRGDLQCDRRSAATDEGRPHPSSEHRRGGGDHQGKLGCPSPTISGPTSRSMDPRFPVRWGRSSSRLWWTITSTCPTCLPSPSTTPPETSSASSTSTSDRRSPSR